MNTIFKCFFFAVCGMLLFSLNACDDEGNSSPQTYIDQQAMLTNIGENVIVPAYTAYYEKTADLTEAVGNFANDPNENTLSIAREAFKSTYLAWQGVTIYEFGPAENMALRMNSNSFPTNVSKIENSIGSGNWDLETYTNVDQKGLPALDYLLFKENALADFTTAADAEARRQYLKEVTNHLNALALQVYNEWIPQEGNYLELFTSNTGNSAASSVSLLINQLNQSFEITKNNRINIPNGGRSINDEPFPMEVEAYYSGISLDLVKANVQATENTFRGKGNETDGLGLDDNIKAHYEAGNIQEDLTATILAQFRNVYDAVDAIPAPLSEAVVNSNEKVAAAYAEMQELSVYLKTDMPQVLSMLITYTDNDGD